MDEKRKARCFCFDREAAGEPRCHWIIVAVLWGNSDESHKIIDLDRAPVLRILSNLAFM